MRPFLTGSRVYGKPSEDSDIDLVIQLSYYELDQLKKLADAHDVIDDSCAGPDSASLIFGKLNLICCTTDDSFAVWKVGTKRCEDIKRDTHKPVLREKAKSIFRKLREKYLGDKFTEEDA